MYTIKQLADLAGVSPKALRIYEQKKLLMPIKRSPAGYRLYNDTSLQILQKICRLKRCQFTLSEIADLLKLPDDALICKLKIQSEKIFLLANEQKNRHCL